MRSANGRPAASDCVLAKRSVNACARFTRDVPVLEALAPAAGTDEPDDEADGDAGNVGTEVEPFGRPVAHHALTQLGPGRAGLFVHLIPVYTVFLAMWFLGEELYWFHAIGIGLIGIGIYLTTMLKSK